MGRQAGPMGKTFSQVTVICPKPITTISSAVSQMSHVLMCVLASPLDKIFRSTNISDQVHLGGTQRPGTTLIAVGIQRRSLSER